MKVSPLAVAAGGAVLLLAAGGAALAASSSSTPNPSPGPTPPAAAPISIIQGHRYQVTLTFGTAPGAANLATNVLPNIAAGLNAVAPGEFSFVHAIAPKDNQIVFVVDAIGGSPGSVSQQSPQTFYADMNPVQSGGLTVQVLDMGPSPVSAPAPPATSSSGPSSPPAATATPFTVITDPALVSIAQRSLAGLAKQGSITVAGTIPTSGTVDATTSAAIVQFQAYELPPAMQSGQLDALTFSIAVIAALAYLVPAAPITDPALAGLAQKALALEVSLGNLSQIDYGASQVNGNASDPDFVAALANAAAQLNKAIGGVSIFDESGTLDTRIFAALIDGAYLPRVVGNGIVPFGPGAVVSNAGDVQLAQTMLKVLSGTDPKFGTITVNGNAGDAATVTAITYFQSQLGAIQHRTTPGVLDFLTFALMIGEVLEGTYSGQTANPVTVTGPLVTLPSLVAGCQDALAMLLRSGRLGAVGAAYDWTDVDGQASNAKFQTALRTSVQAIDTSTRSAGYQLTPNGQLDYYIFAALYVLAYV